MAQSVRVRRYSHLNLVVEHFDASVKHLREVFGAEFLLDLPGPNWHACLMEIGGAIFEFFVPPHFMLNSRHGPHYLGIEFEVDLEEARAAVASHNVRIMRDIVEAIHTHPADGFGVDYEFFGGTFYGPDAKYVTTHCRPAEYWRYQHPLGLTGIKGYTQSVSDIDAGTQFLESLLCAEVVYEEDRPSLAARAVGLQVADVVVELLTPIGEGPLRREMDLIGEGIRSTVFRARDIDQARRYFDERRMPVIQGTAPGSFAIPPKANLGILFEFSE
jgi:catechol 2,3-dioxygenase-like lactoylglutathione lyase family enzyme